MINAVAKFSFQQLTYLITHPILYGNYIKDLMYFKIRSNSNKSRFSINWKEVYPCIFDKTTDTEFDRHYVYFIAWATRVLLKHKPSKHIDIASSLHFCTTISASIPTEFYDYRPADLQLKNLNSKFADLVKLPFKDNSVKSLSCMHVIEHIGLGRYGDPIDPEGDLKAINELIRVLAKGGKLLFVVPTGSKAKIMFNAHRIYTFEQIKEYFKELRLDEFVLIPESDKDGGLVINPSKSLLKKQNYACGCYLFTKK